MQINTQRATYNTEVEDELQKLKKNISHMKRLQKREALQNILKQINESEEPLTQNVINIKNLVENALITISEEVVRKEELESQLESEHSGEKMAISPVKRGRVSMYNFIKKLLDTTVTLSSSDEFSDSSHDLDEDPPEEKAEGSSYDSEDDAPDEGTEDSRSTEYLVKSIRYPQECRETSEGLRAYVVVVNLRNYRVLWKKENAPKLYYPPDSLDMIQELQRLQFIHQFGEYNIMRHSLIEEKYKGMKKELIPKHVDTTESDGEFEDWSEIVKRKIKEVISEIISGVVSKSRSIDQIVYKKFAEELVQTMSKEDFKITDFDKLKITKTFIVKLRSMNGEGEGSKENVDILEAFRKFREDDWYMSEQFVKKKLFEVLNNELIAYMRGEKEGMISKNKVLRKPKTNKIHPYLSNNSDLPAELLTEIINKSKRKRKNGIEIKPLCARYWESYRNILIKSWEEKLKNTIIHFNGEVSSEEGLAFLNLYNNYSELLPLETQGLPEENLGVKFRDACSIAHKQLINSNNIIRIIGKIESNRKKINRLFKRKFIEFRNERTGYFENYLPKNYIFTGLENFADILAAKRISELSRRRYLKHYYAQQFLKPRLVSYKQDIESKNIEFFTFGAIGNPLVRTYQIREDFGITETENISKFGKVSRQVSQFGTYTELISFFTENCLDDSEVASWMLNFMHGDDEEINDFLIPFKQELAIVTFCLFFTEGIRNPGAFVTHALTLLKIREGQLDFSQAINDSFFPMTVVDAVKKYCDIHRFFSIPSKERFASLNTGKQTAKRQEIQVKFDLNCENEYKIFAEYENMVEIPQKIYDCYGLN